MPDHKKTQDDLKKCMKAAQNAADRAACETKFKADGGTTNGGKVFVTPDGDATFVTTGGKVFRGGKVF